MGGLFRAMMAAASAPLALPGFLAHFDGADGSAIFPDESGKTWARTGSGVEIGAEQSKFGGASLYIPADAGNYLSLPSDSSLGIGSNDFTLDFWVRFETFTTGFNPVFDARTSGTQNRPTLYLDNSRVLYYFVAGASRIVGGVLSTGVWYHVAVCRASGITRMFVNGVQSGANYSDSTVYDSAMPAVFGAFGDNLLSASKFNGWIDEARLDTSTAHFTANFTPPTSPYGGDYYFANVASLLHFDGADGSTTFTDVTGKAWTAFGNAQIDTTNSKFGGASGLFDGTGDYINTPANAGFGFGSGDYTVEGWAYRSGSGTDNCLFDNRTASLEGIGVYSTVISGGSSGLSLANNTAVVARSVTFPPNNVWYHWAVVREGTTVRGYQGGVQVFTYTDTRTYASSAPCTIGSTYAGTQGFLGALDDVRVTKGVCRYPGGTSFTPPTAPFPNGPVSGGGTDDYWQQVFLSLPMTSDLADAKGNTITNNGSVAVSGGAAVFNGTNQYLSVAPGPFTGFGRSDFTVEGQFRRNPSMTGAQNRSLFWANLNFLASSVLGIGLDFNNVFTYGTAFSTSVFQHWAIAREGNVVRGYIDGVQVASYTYPSAPATFPAGAGAFIGATVTPSQFLYGELRHLRVTRGYCRYPGGTSFTPPATPYPTSGGTVPGIGPGAHRYWRVYITAVDGGTLAGMSELQFLDAHGVRVETPNGITSSSEVNGSNIDDQAFDGNLSTGWLAANITSPQWIRIDLQATNAYGQPSEIKTLRMWGSWNQPQSSPKDFKLQWSDDGVTWSDAASFTGEIGWAASELRTFTIY